MKTLSIAVLGSVVVFWSAACLAEPSLPALFSDHMVLQQERKISVWGWANPGEKVTVTLAGHSAVTVTNPGREWHVQLAKLPAGGPFTLVVQGSKQIIRKDVMIGEVWIASGQSNMAFALSGEQRAETEVPKADHPQIRLFMVPRRIALSPQRDMPGAAWEICTPDTAKNFSAVAYFFARELHRRLNVPVGVIESAWSGTEIEKWIAPESPRDDPALKPLLAQLNQTGPAGKSVVTEPQALDLELDDFELIPARGGAEELLANFDDGTARTAMDGSFSYGWADAPDARFELVSPGRGGKGFAARIAGQLDGAQNSFLRVSYKPEQAPVDLTPYAGIRFWARGTGAFRLRSLQPTITDWDDYASAMLKASPDWQAVTLYFRDLRQEGWGVVLPFTQDALTGFSLETPTALDSSPMPVTSLFQGMMTPVLGYPSRGVIWYQGESNALKAYQYRSLLTALITGWRKQAKSQDLEFLIVQLPNHGATPEQPDESAWAELREAQFLTAKSVPHTGLAVTIDVGDPKDIHPHRKLEVGERLARWALGTTYQRPIVYSGPLYESAKVEGREMRIHFAHVGAGLEARGGSDLQGFSIAGPDRKFRWASARIEGDTVVVSSSEVPAPVAVRYAWGDSPVCNLFNKDGLPASPFRTDDWPGITH